jgi:hypothetical protein
MKWDLKFRDNPFKHDGLKKKTWWRWETRHGVCMEIETKTNWTWWKWCPLRRVLDLVVKKRYRDCKWGPKTRPLLKGPSNRLNDVQYVDEISRKPWDIDPFGVEPTYWIHIGVSWLDSNSKPILQILEFQSTPRIVTPKYIEKWETCKYVFNNVIFYLLETLFHR